MIFHQIDDTLTIASTNVPFNIMNEGDYMEFGSVDGIALAAMNIKQVDTLNQVGTAVLSNAIDQSEVMGQSMIKMMELSVNPGIGGSFDMSI